ncbi:MAG: hypothetical protein WD049_05815 [Candidatus Paceibacterota bacterium]
MRTITKADLESRYPTPLICGARIARTGDKYLGPERLGADTCRMLGEEQVGWFVGHMPSFERMIEHIQQVNAAGTGGRWVVVPATRFWAETAHRLWFADAHQSGFSSPATLWHDRLVTFCVPERLRELDQAFRQRTAGVAGIMLLDPTCIVHEARSFSNQGFHVAHDRPQLIANFRSSLAVGRWAPPLIVMSWHRAGAVSTERIVQAYCLEAFHFIEGLGLWSGLMPNKNEKYRALPDAPHHCTLATNKDAQWDIEHDPVSAAVRREQADVVPNLAQPA